MFNHNNIHERLNGEFKERLDRIRGLKAELPPVISLMIIYHNFFRPHTSLEGRTPAKAAGINIMPDSGTDPPDANAWITFIQNAALNAT